MVELFKKEDLDPCFREWTGMPEFSHEDLAPAFQLLLSFSCAAEVEEFAQSIGQKISTASAGKRLVKSVWYTSQEIGRYANKRYIQKQGSGGGNS